MRLVQGLVLSGALGLGFAARADQVVLRNGQVLDGVVTEQGGQVSLRLDYGTVSFPRREVREIRTTVSPLTELESARAKLAPDDVVGRRRLAAWAELHGLDTQARALYRQIVALTPDDGLAREKLGYTRVDGRWLTEDEANEARGLVRYGGVWHTKAEVEALEGAAAERRARDEAEERRQAAARQAEADREAAREADDREAERARAEQQGFLGAYVLPDQSFVAYGPYSRAAAPGYFSPWTQAGALARPHPRHDEPRHPPPHDRGAPRPPSTHGASGVSVPRRR